MAELLKINGLETHFQNKSSVVRAVDQVSFAMQTKETVALVGESGSGKSVTSLSLMRLIPQPPGRIVAGEIKFREQELLQLSEKEMQVIRGNQISMIFQEPMTSLNPVHRVGEQIAEVLMLHQGLSKKDALARTVELLKLTGIPAPHKRLRDYPHQLSGGMRQRIMIAMALACRPELLVADEPTTALDVTIQAQILDLMQQMREEFGMAILLITHDLAVVAEMADRVLVMYAGRLVEEAPVLELFDQPLHPYTNGLLRSIPRLHGDKKRLYAIEGTVPDLSELPLGCPFHPRCPEAAKRCRLERPALKDLGTGRKIACWQRSGEEVV